MKNKFGGLGTMTTALISPIVSSQALHILRERYFIKDSEQNLIEDASGMMFRVAKAVAEADKNYGATTVEIEKFAVVFYMMMARMEFLPNSPALMNLGTGQGTASACYVLPIEDSMESISQAFTDQLFIEKFGGGVGFSLSKIRPKGYPISTTQGKACGPIRILKNLSENGKLITQGGRRDGAHMAVMSIYHPDILEFITCKEKEGDIHNFNISVGADSTFMNAVENDEYLRLTWPMDTHSYSVPDENLSGNFIKATDLWEKITMGAWLNGEPGMLWLDRINEDNTTPKLGEILATNPCGEQPLLGNESCNLGSINIAKFVKNGKFDEAGFCQLVREAVHFLDNIIDVNNHPTKGTSAMNLSTRKIGLGLMGWADFLIKLNVIYGSTESFALGERVGALLKTNADIQSSDLGKMKGNFPTFEDSPLNIKHGGDWEYMRNAWRLSIAPTGTISMIADTSSGIEPLMGLAWKKQNMSAALEGTELHYINNDARSLIENDPSRLNGHNSLDEYLADGKTSLKELLTEEEKTIFVTTYDIDPLAHVKMQAVFQAYVDSGISKTINMPNKTTQQDVKDVYFTAWDSRCKGITIYRQGTRLLEVIVSKDELPANTVITSMIQTKKRPRIISGTTVQLKTGHGNLYVTINVDENGMPFEVFSSLGKAGHCEPATLEAISRLISLAFRNGIPLLEVTSQLNGITCHVSFDDGKIIRSVPDGIAKALEMLEKPSTYAIESNELENINDQEQLVIYNPCPSCGDDLHMAEGCMQCMACGFGKCE